MATLQDLLTYIGGTVLRDRPTTITGGTNEPMWTDDFITLHLNQAQNLFARRTWCLRDATTTAVCQITTTAGVSQYQLHASILKVLSARIAGYDSDLIRGGHDEMHPRTEANVAPWPELTSLPNARPRMYSTMEATQLIEFYRTPDQAYTVNMRVARLPLTPLTMSNLAGTPEIRDEYHYDLCDYVASVALNNPEVDGYAPDEAAKAAARWEDSLRKARQDVQRAEGQTGRWFFQGW